MCGIAALVACDGERPLAASIARMANAIRHRGPDGEGFAFIREGERSARFFGGPETPDDCYRAPLAYAPDRWTDMMPAARVALGHRRLSILDLSPAGHQPMSTPDGRFVLIFNGELYNYVELRAELERQAVRFTSHSDTEVVLAAYRTWGAECLPRFNGMFAFVVVDVADRRIFVARDRFGVKPLYYWFSPDGLVAFASEIKAFTVLPGWTARLNHARGNEFLAHGISDHTGETLFAGVHQLRGGECAEVGFDEIARGLPLRTWYEPRLDEPYRGTFEEAAAECRELFIDAVRLRLRADVPVGTGLSGGIDSSSIVCVTHALLVESDGAASHNSFSACSHDERFDERPFIAQVTRKVPVTSHFTFPDVHRLFGELACLVRHQDEPFLSTSVYAEWCVFGLVQETGVKVTLDGHGSDELLAGYHSFLGPHLAALLRGGAILRLSNELRALRTRFGYSPFYLLQLAANMLLPEPVRQPVKRLAGKHAAHPDWIAADHLNDGGADGLVRYGAKTTSVNAFSRSQLFHVSLPMQLHWVDRDSMAHGVESRAPFLDYRLVELLLRLPAEYKLSEGVTKRVFRRAMSGILPDAIRDRRDKMGFVTPESAWITREAPEMFRAAARRAVDQARGILAPAYLRAADAIIDTKQPVDELLWKGISFGQWMEAFDVRL